MCGRKGGFRRHETGFYGRLKNDMKNDNGVFAKIFLGRLYLFER